MINVDDILPRLEKVSKTGPNQWRACCPTHDDKNPSLSVSVGDDDKVLLHCHANEGCTFEDILDELQVRPAVNGQSNGHVKRNGTGKKRQSATYDYCDEAGALLYQKVRYEPKGFCVRRPNGNGWSYRLNGTRRVLYRLPEIVSKQPLEKPAYIVEGEKDADRLADAGLLATCNFDGAGKWSDDYNEDLAGRVVYILPDNDEQGRAHAELVADALAGVAKSVKIVELPGVGHKQDVSDWLDMGNTIDELERQTLLTEAWEPPVSASESTPTGPMSLSGLLEKDFAPLEFLIDGLLAKGHFAILGGRPKSGKSWLMLQCAKSVDAGQSFLGRETRQARVLYIALEDGQRRVHQRAKVLRWQPHQADVAFEVGHFDDDGVSGPGLMEIARWAADYDLIVIDTLIATLSGKANENDNVQMGMIVNTLARIAHETDTAIVAVHHTGKRQASNPFDLLRGASAIRGAYDVGMLVERRQDEREAILHLESRDFDVDNLTIRQVENGAGWECLGSGAEIRKIRAGRKVVEAMYEHGDGLTKDEVAKLIDRSPSSAYRQLTNAEENGDVHRKTVVDPETKRSTDLWFLDDRFK